MNEGEILGKWLLAAAILFIFCSIVGPLIGTPVK